MQWEKINCFYNISSLIRMKYNNCVFNDSSLQLTWDEYEVFWGIFIGNITSVYGFYAFSYPTENQSIFFKKSIFCEIYKSSGNLLTQLIYDLYFLI